MWSLFLRHGTHYHLQRKHNTMRMALLHPVTFTFINNSGIFYQ